MHIYDLISETDCNKLLQTAEVVEVFTPGISETHIMGINVEGHEIIVKAGEVCPRSLSGLKYEANLYKYFLDFILYNNITPHVPEFYGFKNCGHVYNNCDLYALFTEWVKGPNMVTVLENPSWINTDEWRRILFQIIYTLVCFDQLKINHNDLHMANILFDKGIKEDYYYMVDNAIFKVSMNNIVKIIDFDNASVDCHNRRSRLYHKFKNEMGSCYNRRILGYQAEEVGIKNSFSPFFDLFVVLCHIYRNTTNVKVKEFVERVFHISDIKRDHKIYCRTANIRPRYRTIEDVLYDPFFRSLRTDKVRGKHVYMTPRVFVKR